MIKISKDLKIEDSAELKLFLEESGVKVYIYGEILGYADLEKTLDKEESLKEELKEYLNKNKDISDFMRWTIGSFFILISEADQEIKIYTSPKGPGFLYYTKDSRMCIVNNEKYAFDDCIDQGLNIMEIIHYLRAVPNLSPARSPFTTIFKGVRRVPGGAAVSVNNDLSLGIRMYHFSSSEVE